MEEQQQKPQVISIVEKPTTFNNNHDETEQFVDLENPHRQKVHDDDDVSELASVDNRTLYTAYTISTKRFYRYRYVTLAIVVLTIVIIFLSRGAVVNANNNNNNQDVVDNGIDKTVGGDGGKTSIGGAGGGGNTQVAKEMNEKSKKSSKSGKWL